MKKYITHFLCLLVVVLSACAKKETSEKPNIILIYVDDLGYGDVSCYGATEVKTPNVDQLANEGLRFTDGHCTAATCTPSRFSLLTGSYAFRNNAAILPGDAPLLIRPGTATLPSMLQKAGYKTGVIGKWHLGLGDGVINWNKEIKPGPLEIGFDYSFLVPATLDRVPCVFVENRRVVNLDPKDPIKVDYSKDLNYYPNGLEEPNLLKFKGDTQHSNTIIDGISRIGFMSGGKAALWKDEEIANVLIDKVKNFISQNKKDPFFLYFSFTDIHVPRDPNKQFVGKTKMGSRGDAIVQMDWSVGKVMEILKQNGLDENTLVIFTSDNGPVIDDGYYDKAAQLLGKHKPSGPFKGGKYSAYEAGTRVPTIVWWPKMVKKGLSNALVNQVDLYSSLANLTHQKVTGKDAPDSFDMLSTWMGNTKVGRKTMLEESFTLSVRDGDWKYIAPQTKKTPDWLANKDIAVGLQQEPQLYNLANDIGENNDLSKKNPQKVNEMATLLKNIQDKQTRQNN
ncbi:arylsulfatase [Pedobacter psychrophilus]|uniref:Arylsulfatase n=1 Tax=Pedobacter psychrophilus TaxID=1826909 RepID=A0A179DIH5_9SPHI|nr:arylsulfatase [Pedobacter psychrophilus]OAQ40359.1 arylsulfatase [Pedobacter psychrophilus]